MPPVSVHAPLGSDPAAASDPGAGARGVELAGAPTGSYTTEIPFVLPAYRSIEPRLSLRYDSHVGGRWARKHTSMPKVGWRLDVEWPNRAAHFEAVLIVAGCQSNSVL